MTRDEAQALAEQVYKVMERRIIASPPGICPVDLSLAFLKMCQTQTCGKCAPCRIGLQQIANLMDDVLHGRATTDTLATIDRTAQVVLHAADCAVGYEAAKMILYGLATFRDDYLSHIEKGQCLRHVEHAIPCVANCPAGVDIPGYIALVGESRYADAVRLIRKDNPFPTACALVCEHPCEMRCRRNILDAPVNIRAVKRTAVDRAGIVPPPPCAASTGKRVAIIGGGPSGLSAAYYLQLMGHRCTVFEKRKKLGGMLLYGIPSYRLPRERLQQDIDAILATGVEVRLGCTVGNRGDITIESLRRDYDAVYISIGAHSDKKVGIEGEDAKGVISAVEMLGSIGDGDIPDFTGKRVCVIGGGNVAMDCTRSAIRCGAESVKIVYRRGVSEMTAQEEEVQGALSEGAEMLDLYTPVRIEKKPDGSVAALWVNRNMVGKVSYERAAAVSIGNPDERVECDVIVVAVGQGIETFFMEDEGIPIQRGVIQTDHWSAVSNAPEVFAGGDCVTGPASAIRAIAAGKVAANNIDIFLGFHHEIREDTEVPDPVPRNLVFCGRANMRLTAPEERKSNFEPIELPLEDPEVKQECRRCLRCDHFGMGSFKGGRRKAW